MSETFYRSTARQEERGISKQTSVEVGGKLLVYLADTRIANVLPWFLPPL